MTEIQKKARPVKLERLVLLKDWQLWLWYGALLYVIGYLCFASFMMIAISSAQAPFICLGLAMLLIPMYFLAPVVLTFPTTMRARKHLLAHDYFNMERDQRQAINLIKTFRLRRGDSYATLLLNLGLAQMQQGKYEEADQSYSRLISELPKLRLRNKWLKVLAKLNHGAVLVRLERLHEAMTLYDQCEAEIPQLPEVLHPYAIFVSLGRMRALMYFDDGWDEAEDHLRKATAIFESGKKDLFDKSLPNIHFAFAAGHALIKAKQGQFEESLKHCRAMIEIGTASPQAVDVNSGFVLSRLAECYLKAGLVQEAEPLLELSYANSRKYPMHPESAQVLRVYTSLLEATNRSHEVADLQQWLRPVDLTAPQTIPGITERQS